MEERCFEKVSSFFKGSLQKGVKTIAVIDIVAGVLLTLLSVFELLCPKVSFWLAPNNYAEQVGEKQVITAMLMQFTWGCVIFFSSNHLVFGWFLLQGSNMRGYECCQLWFFAQLCLLFMEITIMTTMLALSTIAEKYFAFATISCGYKTYTLWIVYRFMNEIKVTSVSPEDSDEEEITEKSSVL